MRKVVLYLFAALLVVGLPLGALAGTEVYHFKDVPYNNFICYYASNENNPGPAAEFGDCCVEYVGTSHETVRVKTNKDGSIDTGWNREISGTAKVYPSGGTFAAAASMKTSILGFAAQKPTQDPAVLFQGNFQVEEVVQDDGNNANCIKGDKSADLESCLMQGEADTYLALDYIMYHWKINGNSIYFWKTTLKNGQVCWEDTRATAGGYCVPFE
jgi:hypothetical protein